MPPAEPRRGRPARAPRVLGALLAAVLCAPAPVLAWGPTGHRLVADLAERALSPDARAAARRLLAVSGDRTLADVANWADDLRHDRAQRAAWRASAPWHYVNFASPDCRYDANRDCPGGACAVAAIEREARILGDRSRNAAARAAALRYLVHLVADVHQPLHAGYRRDRGGNRYQVQLDGRGTNLHSVWDTPVVVHGRPAWRKYAGQLAAAPPPVAGGGPADWAEESCRLTRDAGIYPGGHTLDDRYLERMQPLAQRRIREAGARLAGIINRELGTRRVRRPGKRRRHGGRSGTGRFLRVRRASAAPESARTPYSRAAAASTRSTVKPKCANRSSAGADAPNVSRPTTAPSRPTYLRQ